LHSEAGVPAHKPDPRKDPPSRFVSGSDARHATIVAVRVATQAEADRLAAWLDADDRRRALLFHSAPYPAGRQLLERYAGRVAVPDPRPSFGATNTRWSRTEPFIR